MVEVAKLTSRIICISEERKSFSELQDCSILDIKQERGRIGLTRKAGVIPNAFSIFLCLTKHVYLWYIIQINREVPV